ncbi:glycoside hydrolase family 3 N-terminal domain-containing protein [Flavicella marina]|uniref:glycoside hydrolase family 3 N-terminal domain-containing protein n=1 Tax=Flavicella marina TaxID=1475951 RepID=UPI001264A6AB|nr:glycoside hydrolase family 3 N-terminal domain-containing protein [Flavicella marina]
MKIIGKTIQIMLLMAVVVFTSCNTENKKANLDYTSTELSAEERVKDLMSRMTLEEKVAQMCQYVGLEHIKAAQHDLSEEDLDVNDARGFYPDLSINDLVEMTKAGKIGSYLHIVTVEEANYLQSLAMQSKFKIPLLIGIDAIHGDGLFSGATIYPSPITQAATWDDELLYKVSAQTAKEMRATGTHWAFTPNIDVLRDPRWGRTGETFGEDPYLVGNMGVATIKGLQSDNFSGSENVIACAKHLVAGSQSLNGLNASPTDVSYRTLMGIFLPPFKRAVQEANLFSIMTAHNEVNGIPAHMDKHMMTDLMRDRWGFDGFYVSDWNDVSRIHTWHHVADSFKQATEFSVGAGLDMHMHGPHFAEYVIELVNEGKLPESRVDLACSKILEVKFRLGLFENPFIEEGSYKEVLFNKEHQESSLEQARKGIVLQKNSGILPLKSSTKKTIFVTGPNANNQTTLGDWVSPQPEENIITMYEGIKKLGEEKGYKVSYFDSGDRSRKMKDADINKAAALAKKADITVLVLGENSFRHDWPNKTTGENIDRATLKLSGRQMELANKVLANGKPVIVVYVSGSPIAEPTLEKRAKAVINTWEPGAFGGQATAEIIFGEVNPSAKLPLTIPRSVGQLQMVYNHKPTMYIHKYNTEKKTPLHPFGFGLSYTQFDISTPVVSSNVVSKDAPIEVSVEVKNTGKMAGEEVVQLYIRDNVSSVTRPVKELKKYQRVALEPGESKTVTMTLDAESLAFYDINMEYCVEPGSFKVMVGNSSADKDLKETSIEVKERIILKD